MSKYEDGITQLTNLLSELHNQKDRILLQDNVSPELVESVDKNLHELLELLREPKEFDD